MESLPSRRAFLLGGSAAIGGWWLIAHLGEIEETGAASQVKAASGQGLSNLTDAEARTLSAFANQIVPTDGLPGAHEAGAIYFIDSAIGGFAAPFKPLVQSGAKALDDAARRQNRRVTSFADLTPAQQVRVMRRSENQPYFGVLRTLSILGVFADPKYGGNRGNAGFRIADVQHAAVYAPPFGYYDAQALQSSKARQP
jgi:gluconate 2-dehydrogenase gamma chain